MAIHKQKHEGFETFKQKYRKVKKKMPEIVVIHLKAPP